MGPAGVVVFVLTVAASSQDVTRPSEEVTWFNHQEEIRRSLPALKKLNELYVAVENARLREQDGCVRQFQPRVESYSADIEVAMDRCRQFVPRGRAGELEDCAVNLTQPILSDIEANLLFIKACT